MSFPTFDFPITARCMTQSVHLPRSHLLLAIAVMAVWGSNFVVIKLALEHLPPLLLATLRFAFAFLPAAFFLKRPAVPLSRLGRSASALQIR